jgi:poly(3-hydroxybutyrate) depolymerase
MRRVVRYLGILALLLVLSPVPPAQAATLYTVAPVAGSLTHYNVSGVYVAGVSSGGYMATQLQVAYSSRIKGAAVFAAGPYYCAQNNLNQALYACMDNIWSDQLGTLEYDTSLYAAYGWIDPTSRLSGQPVYVYHGGNDTTVRRSVTDDLVSYYRYFGSSVTYDSASSAGHSWVTPYGTVSCSSTAAPYLNNCGTDPQNAMLGKLFGSVSAPNTGPLGGKLVKFGQATYSPTGSTGTISMDTSGFAYVPASCQAGATCRLLVALHGCHQGYAAIGTTFVDRANLDQYADTNNMIVLYPQATTASTNPNGCWDWWGYLGQTAYPIHGGYQIETIMNEVYALGG